MILPLDCFTRSPDVAGRLRRKTASQAEQVPCGIQPADTGNRRPGAKEEAAAFPIQDRLAGGHRRQRVKSAPWELEGKIATGQPLGVRPLEGQEAPRVGVTCGGGRQRSEGLTPSYLRGARRGWLAGYQQFSEGTAERRDADLSAITTFTTGLARHNLSINHTRTPGRPTYNRRAP